MKPEDLAHLTMEELAAIVAEHDTDQPVHVPAIPVDYATDADGFMTPAAILAFAAEGDENG